MPCPNACKLSPYFLRTRLDENDLCHLKRISLLHTVSRAIDQNWHHNHRFRQNLNFCPKGPLLPKLQESASHHVKFTVKYYALSECLRPRPILSEDKAWWKWFMSLAKNLIIAHSFESDRSKLTSQSQISLKLELLPEGPLCYRNCRRVLRTM